MDSWNSYVESERREMDKVRRQQDAGWLFYRAIDFYIPNITSGVNQGAWHRVYKICSDTPMKDEYLPPLNTFSAIDFMRTVLFRDTPGTEWFALADLEDIISPKKLFGGTFLLPDYTFDHILERHAMCFNKYTADFATFLKARNQPKFLRKKNTCVYIDHRIILPLLGTTLIYPDRIVELPKRRSFVYEKVFSSEIGHGLGGCCYINRVVVERKGSKQYYKVVTAFPCIHFIST